jgi:hypothetical protein
VKSVTFTDAELQALADLMDAGVRHLGLNSVKNAAVILVKLEQAKEVSDDSDVTD